MLGSNLVTLASAGSCTDFSRCVSVISIVRYFQQTKRESRESRESRG